MFAEAGFTLAVLEPGKPSGMYHAESAQEDFLVAYTPFAHWRLGRPDAWADLPWAG